MAIVVVGGSAKDVGKTSLVCGVIAALPEFAWTAVKITGHDYESVTPAASANDSVNGAIREETIAGTETDTARYLAAGARRALLVTRREADPPMEEIWRALGSDRNVIFESNRIVDVIRPDVCVALVGGVTHDNKASFRRLLSLADVVVSVEDTVEIPDVPAGIPSFHLQTRDRLSPEMMEWLRGRLNAPPQQGKS